jgi:hypothetical protein
VRIALGGLHEPSAEFLEDSAAELAALRAAGLAVILVAGTDMTVAPTGLGAFADPPEGPLATAWEDEWRSNLEAVARALAPHVVVWELLPRPDQLDAFMAPSRWLALVAAGAHAVRSADASATVVPGVLRADGEAEPGATLGGALTPHGAELWHEAGLAGMSLDLYVGPERSEREADVIAEVRRIADNARALATERLLESVALCVVSVSWTCADLSEELQARNLWAAFNTLSAEPAVGTIVWRGLVDSPGDTSGLFRGASLTAQDQRPAWAAFNDFALYATQIAPPAYMFAADDTTAGETIHFHVPSLAEILKSQGLHGRRLDAALAAARALGDNPVPGDYQVELPIGLESGPEYTNQDVISAFYRAGGGTWELLEKSGLTLSDLATDRNAPYVGVPVDSLNALDQNERDRVLGELERSAAGR